MQYCLVVRLDATGPHLERKRKRERCPQKKPAGEGETLLSLPGGVASWHPTVRPGNCSRERNAAEATPGPLSPAREGVYTEIVDIERAKDRRLSFAQGYEDAWARRSAATADPEYAAGYAEGTRDRAATDSRGRRKTGV